MALLGLASQARAEAPKRPTLVFPGLAAREGISEKTAQAVSDVLLSQLHAQQAWDVRSSEDVAAVLGLERQRALMGCTDLDAACLAELGGALNADRMVRGSLSKLGDSVLLTVALIDVRKGRALHQVTERLRGEGSTDALLDALAPLVRTLREKDPQVEPAPATTPTTAAPPPKDAPRGLGLVLGVRGDADVLGPGVAPGVFASFSRGLFRVAGAVLIVPTPGVRAEVHLAPLPDAVVSPYVGAGATLFVPAVAPRGVVGATARLGPLQVGLDVAVEYFLGAPSDRKALALLVGLGVGYAL